VKIVDEFTGRMLEGRRWSEGLHQAVEAKEGVKIKEENQTLATVTLQNYFRMYDKLAGMTGTALTEAAEFMNTYDLQVVPIPTHRPIVASTRPTSSTRPRTQVRRGGRRHRRAHERDSRCWSARSRSRSPRLLSRMLDKRGIPTRCSTRSSTRVRPRSSPRPAVSDAVTVATNMAGRGVDILLGGNPEGLPRGAEGGLARFGFGEIPSSARRPATEAAGPLTSCSGKAECKAEGDKVRELGGLYVLGTERHESPPHRQPAAWPLRSSG
jgi:preprotein translocase subunit SecA